MPASREPEQEPAVPVVPKWLLYVLSVVAAAASLGILVLTRGGDYLELLDMLCKRARVLCLY